MAESIFCSTQKWCGSEIEVCVHVCVCVHGGCTQSAKCLLQLCYSYSDYEPFLYSFVLVLVVKYRYVRISEGTP